MAEDNEDLNLDDGEEGRQDHADGDGGRRDDKRAETDDGRDAGEEGRRTEAAEDDDPPEVKAIAKRLGWKEDFQGDPAKRVSAGQFIDNTRQVIYGQRDKLARLEPLVERLAKETARLRGESDADRNARLDAALEAAIEAGDVDKAKELVAAARKTPAAEPPAAVENFQRRNAGWYGVDPEATAYAESLDRRFAQANGGVQDPEQHMARVEAGVKKLFPQHFADGGERREDGAERRQAPPANRGSRMPGRARTDGKTAPADLTSAERQAARAFNLTDQEYCDQINADRA